jgi:DNA polymerase-3 subunit gamma/tau
MRDAESTLDQLISFCGGQIEETDVLSMFGLAAQSQLLELARTVLDGEVEKALRLLNDLAKNGKDLGRLLSDLLNHFRNLLIFQVSRGDLNLLEVSEAEAGSLREQSATTNSSAVARIMEVLANSETRLRDAASKKIFLEVTLLKAMEARQAVGIDAVLKRLQQLRDGNSPDASSAASASQTAAQRAPNPPATSHSSAPANPDKTAPPVSHVLADASVAAAAPVAVAAAGVELETLWSRLVESIGRASPFTRTYLLEAHPVSFAKNVLVVGFDPQFEDHIALVDNARNHTLMQTRLADLGHPNAQFKFIKAEAPPNRAVPVAAPAPPADAAPGAKIAAPPLPKPLPVSTPAAKERLAPIPFNKDDFKNDPLIQKALEIFKGQIVEVRA